MLEKIKSIGLIIAGVVVIVLVFIVFVVSKGKNKSVIDLLNKNKDRLKDAKDILIGNVDATNKKNDALKSEESKIINDINNIEDRIEDDPPPIEITEDEILSELFKKEKELF